MTLGRAIVASMICHLAVVGYGFMQPVAVDSMNLDVVYESDARTFQFRQPNRRRTSETERDSRAPYAGVDVTAGLTPEGDEPPEVQSERESRSELKSTSETTPRPEPEETKTASAEPAPEPSEEESQRKPAPDEDSERPVESEEAPTPAKPEPESAGEQKVAANSDESTSSGESTGGGSSASGSSQGTPGGGGESAAGAATGDGEGSGGGGGVDRGKLMRGYAQSIYELIAKHRTYPKTARRAGLEGTVIVEVRIDASGRILALEVDESSGHKTLDRAAEKTLRKIDRLPAPPDALAWNEKRLRIPIRYNLDRRG